MATVTPAKVTKAGRLISSASSPSTQLRPAKTPVRSKGKWLLSRTWAGGLDCQNGRIRRRVEFAPSFNKAAKRSMIESRQAEYDRLTALPWWIRIWQSPVVRHYALARWLQRNSRIKLDAAVSSQPTNKKTALRRSLCRAAGHQAGRSATPLCCRRYAMKPRPHEPKSIIANWRGREASLRFKPSLEQAV
jgi:hypothetical protein